ncbi:hypothetical protein [Limnoglobus roseus]|uniref:Uncharacterized protein n=1 Tax=Limnoglobus roseus TaxID=2598579 RepID=A0A5C1AFG6_9BACT|nr:hypothetical protein [Limnoglobus roseus]QEL17550.1 hypothetical protein PX52LOC_04540 [Limnoglobus roseus]
MGDGFEPVHEVVDYCDGPRSGFADFRGRPHWFCAVGWLSPPEDGEAEWDVTGFDPRDNRFQLVPVAAPNGSQALARGTFRVREPAADLPAGQFRILEVHWEPYGCIFLG